MNPSAWAPFAVRNFRFLWPANLLTSWAFEMETVVLGWYVLVETKSVFLLTVFGSLQWFGTLLSPMYGVIGDRVGHRNLLCAMRVFYALQAVLLMVLALTATLNPWWVLAISALMGMARPSDLVMRYALIAETIPREQLVGTMGIERTTSDSARVFGALSGAGLFSLLGIGMSYAVIAGFYLVSILFTLAVTKARQSPQPATSAKVPASSPWGDLREVVAYVLRTPLMLAAMSLAFMVNLTAYPLVLGLLPYVAKELYQTDQTGLGYLVASFSFGGLIGSVALMHIGHRVPTGRWMVVFCTLWYVMLAFFAQTQSLWAGIGFLILAGIAQSCGLVPLAALMLRHCDERYRGRIMGLRMFAIYGLPIGLMVAGPIIGAIGFPLMALMYCVIGIAFVALITARWYSLVWPANAVANRRA